MIQDSLVEVSFKMTMHLNQLRRILETIMALYAGGFGIFIIFTISMETGNPLWWVGFDIPAQNVFALLLMFAGTIHAWGIAINGRWRWSPLLRVIGMAVHAIAITYLVVAIINSIGPHGIPSGLYSYSVTAGMFWYLVWKAMLDLRNSFSIVRLCSEF